MKKFLLFFFLFIFLLKGLDVAIKKSITYDETVHIPAGYFYIKKGDFLINYEHPPFCKILSGLFISKINIKFPQGLYNSLRFNEWTLGITFFYINKENVNKIALLSRLPIIFLGLITGIFVYLWGKELYGEIAGLFSLFLFTFCPNFIAHSCLVTTDVGFSLFFLTTFYFLYKFFEYKNLKYLILTGISAGFAFSTKFTGIILLPLILVFSFFYFSKFEKYTTKAPISWYFISLILIPVFILLLNYYFVNLKWFFIGLKRIVFETTERGHTSYLNGKFSQTGWRYYFILAFLYKTPFSFIIFLIFSFLLKKLDKKEKFLILPSLIYFIFASLSKKQIGIRYILPIYPFLYIFCGRILIYGKSLNVPEFIKKFFFYTLSLLYLISSIKIHPDYIAYFNEFIGPENGWKYLIDSNIDWGQDLKELKKFIEKEKNPEIMLNYFGAILPETYDIVYEPFLYPFFMFNVPEKNYHINSTSPKKEYLAISVNHLCGLTYEDTEIFKFLKEKKPYKKAGYSIFIYDITNDLYLREKIMELLYRYGFKIQAERQKRIIEKIKNEIYHKGK